MVRVARADVATKEAAEDVVQDAWLGVIQGLDRFEGRSSLKTWMFRIVLYKAMTRDQNGTVRFGHDPTTSALDVNCRMHEIDNVYAVDSSFFVSSSAVNPTLTIIANARRVADHLADRLTAQ